MTTTTKPAANPTGARRLQRHEGVRDLWWPFGPGVGRYTIKCSGEQTEGRMIQMLVREQAGAVTPLHAHTDTDESFYVIAGEVLIELDGERIEAGAGDYVLGPRGLPHAWAVVSESAEILVTCAGAGTRGPSGFGMHGFFEEVARPLGEGVKPEPQMPDAELFARRMSVYGIELLGPPPFEPPAEAR